MLEQYLEVSEIQYQDQTLIVLELHPFHPFNMHQNVGEWQMTLISYQSSTQKPTENPENILAKQDLKWRAIE